MKNKTYSAILILFCSTAIFMLMISCATIIHGTKQKVGFASSPSGATVSIDNESKGQTPVVLKLKRNDDHLIRLSMPGYYPSETTLVQKLDGWVFGNILVGGLIGVVVDAADGGMYKLVPDKKNNNFKNATFKKDETKKGVKTLSVVLSPDQSQQTIVMDSSMGSEHDSGQVR